MCMYLNFFNSAAFDTGLWDQRRYIIVMAWYPKNCYSRERERVFFQWPETRRWPLPPIIGFYSTPLVTSMKTTFCLYDIRRFVYSYFMLGDNTEKTKPSSSEACRQVAHFSASLQYIHIYYTYVPMDEWLAVEIISSSAEWEDAFPWV